MAIRLPPSGGEAGLHKNRLLASIKKNQRPEDSGRWLIVQVYPIS